eukprot:TRINITY_DN15214_c0_g1_i2.p1 TRINITY_DN15214_c0_g1~~TRINITY_DN15214_c0_g1_i2.p1  ORF type:complete len:289 (-),score=14.85 TRINITY_DN15214_c0_g1_i2:357-1223(-)
MSSGSSFMSLSIDMYNVIASFLFIRSIGRLVRTCSHLHATLSHWRTICSFPTAEELNHILFFQPTRVVKLILADRGSYVPLYQLFDENQTKPIQATIADTMPVLVARNSVALLCLCIRFEFWNGWNKKDWTNEDYLDNNEKAQTELPLLFKWGVAYARHSNVQTLSLSLPIDYLQHWPQTEVGGDDAAKLCMPNLTTLSVLCTDQTKNAFGCMNEGFYCFVTNALCQPQLAQLRLDLAQTDWKGRKPAKMLSKIESAQHLIHLKLNFSNSGLMVCAVSDHLVLGSVLS